MPIAAEGKMRPTLAEVQNIEFNSIVRQLKISSP